MGLRNDVLTTCKAVTSCGGQRIIILWYVSHSKYFRSEKRSGRGNYSIIIKIISCLFAFFAYRISPLVMNLQNASGSHCNRVNS